MITVGIIANPASGKDIRRLVAHGSVFDNEEKVNIVRRVLCGLEATGVERVLMMPESFGIGQRAIYGLQLSMAVEFLSMPLTFRQEDSRHAAVMMAAAGVGCIVTLGGDGTNRMIAKGCGSVPLMPISTGTNNVFPQMIEGTIAGLAAGLVARGIAAARTTPRVDVFRGAARADEADAAPDDIALVDAVVYAERFIASRAVWDTAKIRELVLTRAEPGNIGLSSIGGHLVGGQLPPNHGLFVQTGAGGPTVLAPIAPGLIRPVPIHSYRALGPGDEVTVSHNEPSVLALDGERELELPPGAVLRMRLNLDGPRVVAPQQAIELASQSGIFIR